MAMAISAMETAPNSTRMTVPSASSSLQEGYAIHPNTWKSLGEQLVVIHRTGYLKLRKNFYFKG